MSLGIWRLAIHRNIVSGTNGLEKHQTSIVVSQTEAFSKVG